MRLHQLFNKPYWDAYAALYGRANNSGRKGRFCKDRLPSAHGYYEAEFRVLKGCGPWRITRCVFHQDSHPSLSVNIETGAFRCFACGEKGGDIVDFHQRRYGVGFVEAAKHFQAWED